MATALGAVGADPSVGKCESLRRELSGEPDVGNLHLRFDEGRAGRATCVAFSPTLPPSPGKRTRREDHVPSHRPQMSSGRLFLDRVGRHQSPSPLHRHIQNNPLAFRGTRNYHRTAGSVLTVHLGLRPAKPYENVSEFRTMELRSGEIEQTVEKSRLFNCLIRSVRIERISGRCLS
jgi:hypothetical protein